MFGRQQNLNLMFMLKQNFCPLAPSHSAPQAKSSPTPPPLPLKPGRRRGHTTPHYTILSRSVPNGGQPRIDYDYVPSVWCECTFRSERGSDVPQPTKKSREQYYVRQENQVLPTFKFIICKLWDIHCFSCWTSLVFECVCVCSCMQLCSWLSICCCSIVDRGLLWPKRISERLAKVSRLCFPAPLQCEYVYKFIKPCSVGLSVCVCVRVCDVQHCV